MYSVNSPPPIITSSQAIPPCPDETFLLRLTIFRFDFLVEPSGLKTLFPLIVTFNRNLKCNLWLVKVEVSGMKANTVTGGPTSLQIN